MNRIAPLLLLLGVVIWGALVLQGFSLYFSLEPTDSGFTRGLNRVKAFLQWQVYALIAAVVTSMIGRHLGAKGGLRIVSRIPLWISGGFLALLVVTFIGLIVWTRLF